ncbi:TonB-dependent receptor domain protein [Verrucomicrobiia bacterium DG1235]|nr:TonB-dependent receptor domain protein [Verrucomicrobiae bacterium DG1235]
MKTSYALIALLPLCTATLHAQQNASVSDPDTIIEYDQITVFSENVAQANTVLRNDLKEVAAPLTSALDHIDRLPGVIVQEGDAYGGDDWSTTVSIRGFATTRSSSQLGYTIDDLPNGNTNYGGGAKPNRFIDSENIGQVTVSQGAGDIASASTTALGGTIQYSLIEPSYNQGGTLEYSTGDNNMQRYFFRYNTGLIGEDTRAFVSFSDSFHNRWTEEGENGIADRIHSDMRLITKWGNVEVDARLSYDDIHEDNYNGVSLAQFAENPNWDRLTGDWSGMPNPDQYFVEGWSTVRENSLLGVKFTIPFSDDATLELQPYFHNQTGEGHWIPPYQRRGFRSDGTPESEAAFADFETRVFFQDAAGNDLHIPVNGLEGAPDSLVDQLVIPTGDVFDINSYPEAVRAGAIPVSSFRTSHYGNDRIGLRGHYTHYLESQTIQLGFWHENQERFNGRDWHQILDARLGMQYDHQPYWTDFDQTFDTETTMLYAQDTIELGDSGAKAQVGLKQYYVDISGYDNMIQEPIGSQNSDSDILPSLGLTYELNEGDDQVFFNYSQNYAAITDNILQRDASPNLEPEQSDNIDLGYRFNRNGLSFSSSLYFIEFDNKISFIPPYDEDDGINYDIGTGGGYVNVGGIESKGLEIAADYTFNSNLSAFATLTYNDSEYTENVPETGVIAGNEVVGAPSEILSASLFYRSDNGFYSSLSAKHTGERQGTLDNSEQMDAFTRVDLSLGYRSEINSNADEPKHFKAELHVYNLFDASYLATPDGDARSSNGYYFIGAPRAVSATVGIEF